MLNVNSQTISSSLKIVRYLKKSYYLALENNFIYLKFPGNAVTSLKYVLTHAIYTYRRQVYLYRIPKRMKSLI